ncbi:aminotransferase [Actinoplanes italicus]|uniref:Capreomycidine synthase n=1 Tax=Actinoplanes italicus TaxID=113567 RepID=A0A2T0JLZ6_9ACTN|nr:capreomycidine synthase [Actinoplanes italicus]PRX08626.1 capreomycidine synthase [Actinoplanes italicus]GIE36591.1 aminotransferase [Actinoplanes italicus]
MRLRPAPLEDWLRDYYFTAEIDISSSGVEPYSMTWLRQTTGLGYDEIDTLVFDDGYSLGAPPVRQVIADRWGDGDARKVMTTSGSSEAITLVLTALLEAGDRVVVVEPGYHSLVRFAEGLGCDTVTWRLDADAGFTPSLDELAELVDERTRAIIVNFPQNPTGVSITEPELRRLVAIAEGAGAYLLWDAAFADLTYETAPLPCVSTLYSRGIGFGTFSKAFGLPGLRFGWCLAPPEVLAGCVRVRDYTTLHVAPLIELLALRVLENADAFIGPRRERARANRELLRRWAQADPERVSLRLPDGGVAAFPRLLGLGDTYEFCDKLFLDRGVLVIPGSCFGAPEHIRVGFGGPTEALAEGLDRLSAALSDSSLRERSAW